MELQGDSPVFIRAYRQIRIAARNRHKEVDLYSPVKEKPVESYGSEGEFIKKAGNFMEREIVNIKEWLNQLDGKVDQLISEGCSHRGNDLAKLARIEAVADSVRGDASKIRESVYQLGVSLEAHKTDLVRSSALTDGKISNLKIWILAQCLILLVGAFAFTAKELWYSHSKTIQSNLETHIQEDRKLQRFLQVPDHVINPNK